jgi:hypothetical protein
VPDDHSYCLVIKIRIELSEGAAEPVMEFTRPMMRGQSCGFEPCNPSERIMKSPNSLMLTTLAVVGLTVVPPAFSGSAIAATAEAKPLQGHAGSAKRHHVAHSACQPTSMYFNGQRVCVDPTPYTYYTDPIDGSARLLWPR